MGIVKNIDATSFPELDTSKSAPEDQSWIEWIRSIVQTLNESDKLLIYEMYD